MHAAGWSFTRNLTPPFDLINYFVFKEFIINEFKRHKMRRIAIFMLASAMFCTAANAKGGKKIPDAVTRAFNKLYPNANRTKWQPEDRKYEASFELNDKKMSVLFSEDGTLEETETAISKNNLPAKALKFALSKGKVKEAAKIVRADGTLIYEAEVNGKDLLFDKDGNILTEHTDK
ncbi:MAG: hypothetical protein EBZ77_07840 [Chitinophagia bacterium]|nr:hypothetical protein [Chitinophagia bacterium]